MNDIDLSKTIAPKSDQLNFDDLIGNRTMTIKVTKVSASVDPAQPISINFEGDNGKPYKPCKSMRRVLVNAWGEKGAAYVGRSMTLYGDPTVKFGGIEVGGIRISHLSNIDKEITMALTASKSSRKPYTVKPLFVAQSQPVEFENPSLVEEGDMAAEHGTESLKTFWSRLKAPQQKPMLHRMDEWKKRAAEIDAQDPSRILNAG